MSYGGRGGSGGQGGELWGRSGADGGASLRCVEVEDDDVGWWHVAAAWAGSLARGVSGQGTHEWTGRVRGTEFTYFRWSK
jgi:hypothetical protein